MLSSDKTLIEVSTLLRKVHDKCTGAVCRSTIGWRVKTLPSVSNGRKEGGIGLKFHMKIHTVPRAQGDLFEFGKRYVLPAPVLLLLQAEKVAIAFHGTESGIYRSVTHILYCVGHATFRQSNASKRRIAAEQSEIVVRIRSMAHVQFPQYILRCSLDY